MYRNGDGVPQDHKTALKWYTLAAEQGHADAQFGLGVMYDSGRGVIQDDKAALKWYTLAAEQAQDSAQYNLGWMYDYHGKYGEAEPLYKRAIIIRVKSLGWKHPQVKTGIENLATLYRETDREAEAEKLEKRAAAMAAKER